MGTNRCNGGNAIVSVSQKLNQMVSSGSRDYNAWRLLISEIETSSPEDIDLISLAYDSFLSTFPLCHWHLEKYAHHKANMCGAEEAIKVYERGVRLAMYSVGFWADYFTFGTTCFRNPEDVRRLFGRAISFVGKDYFCHVLWDKYMKYEFSQEGWSFLALSYLQALRFPTKKLQFYYDNFKQFVTNLVEEMGSETYSSFELKNDSLPCAATEVSRDDIYDVIKDLLNSSDLSVKCKALYKYRSIGELLYKEACWMDKEIKCFETKIRRRYFLATSVDDDELNNWHQYLDFIKKQDNLDLAVAVYERCLIPCAHYSEFWLRYVEFLESKRGRELALSAMHRATQIFLKNVSEIHIFNARYKEQIGDIDGARAALLLNGTETDAFFIENIVALANLERRLGNYAAASSTYKKAIKAATEKKKLHILPSLYSHFSRLTFLTTGSADAARDVLIDGLHQVPHCKLLLEELIRFAMTHEGSNQVSIVDSVISDVISPTLDDEEGLNAKDREDISNLFLEFVNLCGTIEDVMRAWNRHVKLFPKFLRINNSNKSCHVTVTNQPSYNTLQLQQQQVQGNISTQDNNNSNSKETVPTQCDKKSLFLSNGDTFQNNELSPRLLVRSREGVVSKLSDQCEDNVLRRQDSDQLSHHPREDEPERMDFNAQLPVQSQRSAQEVEKSDASLSNFHDVQPELSHELKKQKLQISIDHISYSSQEINMSSDGPETKRDVPGESIQHNESVRNESVSSRINTTHIPNSKMPPSTGENPIEIDSRVPVPRHSSSQFHTTKQGQEQSTVKGFNDKMFAQDQELPVSIATPSNTTRPLSASPQLTSYPQQNTEEDASLHNQTQWQTQQNIATNPMSQYQYNQQQLMQQQYQQQQQQMYMQYPYQQYQQYYMNQQPYQLQAQQHMNQYYSQEHQLQQFMPYQMQQQTTSYQQGQGPQPSATQAQFVWPRYPNYQQMNYQMQSQEGSVPMQNEHVGLVQKQQDEQIGKHNQLEIMKENPIQSTSQSGKGL